MNELRSLTLIGVFHPLEESPGFGIPVFQNLKDNTYWVQQFDDDYYVVDFALCDFHIEYLRTIPRLLKNINIEVGSSALFAFAEKNGEILVETREHLIKILRHRTPIYLNDPFVLNEIANFIDDKRLQEETSVQCREILFKSKKAEKAQHKSKMDLQKHDSYIRQSHSKIVAHTENNYNNFSSQNQPDLKDSIYNIRDSIRKNLEQDHQVQEVDSFKSGDIVKVYVNVIEDTLESIRVFEGKVINRQGSGVRETFTVRRVSYNVGVERTFPVHSPRIEKIEVIRNGRVFRVKNNTLRSIGEESDKIKGKH